MIYQINKNSWIKALRDAAHKYHVAAPGTLFDPHQCPVCKVAFSITEDWEYRCKSCIFYKFKCHYQQSFENAYRAFKRNTFNRSDILEENTKNLLLIRANDLENLADNIESIPDNIFPEWVEYFNAEYEDYTPIY